MTDPRFANRMHLEYDKDIARITFLDERAKFSDMHPQQIGNQTEVVASVIVSRAFAEVIRQSMNQNFSPLPAEAPGQTSEE